MEVEAVVLVEASEELVTRVQGKVGAGEVDEVVPHAHSHQALCHGQLRVQHARTYVHMFYVLSRLPVEIDTIAEPMSDGNVERFDAQACLGTSVSCVRTYVCW